MGVVVDLIEPAWLCRNHTMHPRRCEEMHGSRLFGLPLTVP